MRYVQGNNICDGDADLKTSYNKTPPTPVKQWEKKCDRGSKARASLLSQLAGGDCLLPAASPEAFGHVTRLTRVFSPPLQWQARKSALCLQPAVRRSGARNVLHYWHVSSLPCAAAYKDCDH